MILQYGSPVGMQGISLKVNTSVFLSLAESFWKGFELDQREHLTNNIAEYHPCLYHQPPILSANVFLWGVRF